MATDTILEATARSAHEANRAYCIAIGDDSQPSWGDAPEWQRSSAITGVRAIIINPGLTSEQSHEGWTSQKLADGWTFGRVKASEAKTHHCLVPYDDLPPSQRAKDAIFGAVVRAMLKALA